MSVPKSQAPDSALLSNAGDQYHFVYASRRMLFMLHQRRDLRLIQMEGVAEADVDIGSGPETFLAVDLTEYYGGEDRHSADRIVITQVKYSPKHPRRPWTLSRLCANESSSGKAKHNSSVIRKLASSFNAYARDLGTDGIRKVEIQLHTNRPLASDLRKHLTTAKTLIGSSVRSKYTSLLCTQKGQLLETLSKLKEVTGLSWARLAEFILCWNLDEFGQRSLTASTNRLFDETAQYRRTDTRLFVAGLLKLAADSATIGNPQDVRPGDVFAALQIRRQDFIPAPYKPPQIEHLVHTESMRRLPKLVADTASGFVLVHGRGGTGKSVMLHTFAHQYAGGDRVIVYDCWADGVGLTVGDRYPSTVFLTQVTNDLDHLFHTEILCTRKDDIHDLVHCFNEALQIAAEKAKAQGHRLVIVVDAVDNAVYAQEKFPHFGDSFVPFLSKLNLPDNCVVVAASRTENINLLELPPLASQLAIKGFSSGETSEYVHRFSPTIDDDVTQFAHERTYGNPRVLSKLMNAATDQPPHDWRKYIDERAKDSLHDYYHEALDLVRRHSPGVHQLLALLLELRPPWNTELLAAVLTDSRESIQEILSRLRFGLDWGESGHVRLADQDFFDFVRDTTEVQRQEAKLAVAQFCIEHTASNEYAERHLIYHLFQAEQFNELLNRQLEGHLARRIEVLAPHQEDVLPEIRYGLVAAIKQSRYDDALKLLCHAAAAVRGKDVFAEQLSQHIPVAVRFGYHLRILSQIEGADGSSMLQFGAELAKQNVDLELAREMMRQGDASIKYGKEEWSGQDRGFTLDDVGNIAMFHRETQGIRGAFLSLRRWTPKESISPLFADVTEDGQETIAEFTSLVSDTKLDRRQKLFATIGFFVSHRDFSRAKAEVLFDEICRAARSLKKNERQSFLEMIPRIVLVALGRRVKRRNILPLFEKWTPARPRVENHRWNREIDNLYDFLRHEALATLLLKSDFVPAEYTPPDNRTRQQRERPTSTDRSAEELASLRKQMGRHYHACYAYMSALCQRSAKTVAEAIERGLSAWKSAEHDYRIRLSECLWEYAEFACESLRAICLMNGNRRTLVQRICAGPSDTLQLYPFILRRMANVLLAHGQYRAVAESLMEQYLASATAATVPANERVSMLLEVCETIARIDATRAADIFERAREEASKWDVNSDHRAASVTNLSSIVQKHIGLDRETVLSLAQLAVQLPEIDSEGDPKTGEFLRLISSGDVPLGIHVLRQLEAHGHATIGNGLMAIAKGLVEKRALDPSYVWPLVHFEHGRSVTWSFFKQLADALIDAGKHHALDRLLRNWSLEIRRCTTDGRGLDRVQEFMEWADRRQVSSKPAVGKTNQYLELLDRDSTPRSSSQLAIIRESERTPNSLRKVARKLTDDHGKACEMLIGLSQDQLKDIGLYEVENLLDRLIDDTDSEQSAQVASFINGLTPRSYDARGLPLLTRLAARTQLSATSHDVVLQEARAYVKENIGGILYREMRERRNDIHEFLSCDAIDSAFRLSAFLEAAEASLYDLTADGIYTLVSLLAQLIDGKQAKEVLRVLLDDACKDLPTMECSTTSSELTAEEALVDVVIEHLGDPRTQVAIAASYAVVDMAIEKPDLTLPRLLKRARDESSERWMSLREFALFAVRQLAERHPRLFAKSQII